MVSLETPRKGYRFETKPNGGLVKGEGGLVKVILKQAVKGVGAQDEVVDVSDGYARNFLIRRELAVEATPATLNALNQKKARASQEAARLLENAREAATRLEGKTITLRVKVGQGGRTFGSVTAQDISRAIEDELSLEVDKRQIHLPEPLKSTGLFPIQVRLHPQVSASINIEVVEA